MWRCGRTRRSWSFLAFSTSIPPRTRTSRLRRTRGSLSPSPLGRAPARLRGPIANSRNVPLRTRRRRASSALLRSALAMALMVTLALIISRVMEPAGHAARLSAGAAAVPPNAAGSASLPVVPGLEDGACTSLAPTRGHAGQTIFIDAGHGGLDPGVVGTTPSGRVVLEKDATLAVASRLAAVLRAGGC